MRTTQGVAITLLTALATACSSSATAPTAAPRLAAVESVKTEAQKRAICEAAYLAKLTPREKLAQLLTVGVRNVDDARAAVSRHQVGGIFFASWTDRALLTTNQLTQVKAAAKVPLMVTIDEEGGRVSRINDLLGGSIPPARTIANTMSPEQAYQMYLHRAQRLKALGITVDFAPDVDVSSQGKNTVIGDRSYSTDPAAVTRYAEAMIRALNDAGLSAVIKHFPGHGSASGDSHKSPVTTPPLGQLIGKDLVPYRNILGPPLEAVSGSAGASQEPAVMIGHLTVPGLTAPGFPASLSPPVMQLLRHGVGYGAAPFSGVIFTDDLSGMAAITNLMGVPTAVLSALQAGADNALWTSIKALPQVLDLLERAVAEGKLTWARVDASVMRIARFKGALTC